MAVSPTPGEMILTFPGRATAMIDLPFWLPLEEWRDPHLIDLPRGISRHVVRFVRIAGDDYAVKETTDRLVAREHHMLGELGERGVPVVAPYGTVTGRTAADGEPLGGLLITCYLQDSVPYRSLFADPRTPDVRARLIDALAVLFVRLHLAGFFWGDCSLSNTLFRHDAGALAAYLVDVETGELYERLSDGQRQHDLTIATENILGELLDVESSGVDLGDDPVDIASGLRPTYDALWWELTSEEVIQRHESHLIDHRVRRLNQLGFDVEQMMITPMAGGELLRFQPQIFEPAHHARRLRHLVGLEVEENEARTLLADIARFRARWEAGVGHPVAEDAAARAWLGEKFYGTLALVAADVRASMPDAELYYEISQHRWFMSEVVGYDVGREHAVERYVGRLQEVARNDDPKATRTDEA